MFAGHVRRSVASMSEIDAVSLVWSDLGVSELVPTGTVTLLLADVEGSTRLWETQPEEMTAAFANLDRALAQVVDAHHGVRPIEQGEGDSFVIAFGRASDAVACALELQRAPLAPIRLRIGLHTGEVQLRDEANYIGPTINRTARLRDLAHGGQTVLSNTTGDLVEDRLPAGGWLTDLGTHAMRDLPRPERVMQLCHPEIRNEFPPLRTSKTTRSHNLPAQLTSFVGRQAEMDELGRSLSDNRFVTLTGAGGAGKTRLAIEVASRLTTEFDDGVCYVELAPITDPALVQVAVARALGLRDEPGRSALDSVARFVDDRRILMVLDNCEHVLDAVADLTTTLLSACAQLSLLTTSREPIGLAGEVIYRVPSLSLDDEAIELFADRARRARPALTLTDENARAIAEICHRLDGVPLAIELAAARVRALSLEEILDGLHDRFRLLTGGSRGAVRRQQTLRASVDWSHALLTEPERVLLRQLAVFMGGFDIVAAEAIAGGDVERHQVIDLITLLVDKSLVNAEYTSGPTRYRLLETVRQYALEKLGDSGEADVVRTRHRDHYNAAAAKLDAPRVTDIDRRVDWADGEIDNLRGAFTWSLELSQIDRALELASALHPLWVTKGRFTEGLSWFDTVLNGTGHTLQPALRGLAMADQAALDAYAGAVSLELAQQALAIARDIGDQKLTVRALTACAGQAVYRTDIIQRYLDEGIDLARKSGEGWWLRQLLGWRAFNGNATGDLGVPLMAAEEGCALADAAGDGFHGRIFRLWLALAKTCLGDLAEGNPGLRRVLEDADAAHDPVTRALCLITLSFGLTYQGEFDAARVTAEESIAAGAAIGGYNLDNAYAVLGLAAFAAGDLAEARIACEKALHHQVPEREPLTLSLAPLAEVATACGDPTEARRWADTVVSKTSYWHLMRALGTRARVALAQGEPQQAERDVYDALAMVTDMQAHLMTPDLLETRAVLTARTGGHSEAARLFGAAHAMRLRIGVVRFKIDEGDYVHDVEDVRTALGDSDFEAAWDQGAALSTEEALAYAQRGRGERKRPDSGWESLTPTERDVVKLVSEGLANADVAKRLFISPRTVQTHLTHVYAKLGLTSRVQLVQEAARHT
jgi:predicted ATPase/class 3 adenylate cyclase/DNA-binding CsgD family transcriptional regulator